MKIFIFIAAFISSPVDACTAFSLASKDKVIVAKSYDWYVGHNHGAVYTNARGCHRSALNLGNTPNPAKWVSQYGSVVFTQFGRGFPIGGINEKGLVVEMQQLEETIYNSHQSSSPFVNEAQWTQYQLDNYATTDEVLANIDQLRIVQAYTGIHYFISDASGKTAVIEFLDGKAVVFTGRDLPSPVIANDTYPDSLAYIRANPENKIPPSQLQRFSKRRFQAAAVMLGESANTPVEQWLDLSWNILDAVQMKLAVQPSQWNTVYDISSGQVYFRMLSDGKIKSFNIKNLDFSNRQGKALDMNIDAEGNVESLFVEYTDQFNSDLVQANRFLIGPTKRNAAIKHGKEECL